MSINSPSKPTNVLQEIDVLCAPMCIEHKNLVLSHFRRLRKILDEVDEDAIGSYTSKQAAREQLARMTLVFRDYETMRRKGEIDETVESMVADVIDASFALGGRRGTYNQPVFASSFLMGREQEIAALMQELEAESIDEVLELWNAPPKKSEKVVPDYSAVANLAADINWTTNLVRSKSEDNIVLYRRRNVLVKDRPKITRELSRQNLADLNFSWPPTSAERASFTERPRMHTDASEFDGWDWGDWTV